MEPKQPRNTMMLGQMNSLAHNCIRKPQIVAAAQSGRYHSLTSSTQSQNPARQQPRA
jgi:hypothetical protein